MARGGKRIPSPRTPPGGPGQFSRRTDGQQIATPGIGGESSLQYGDVSKLESAQRVAPLPTGTPPPKPVRRPQGSPVRNDTGIPPQLLTMDPTRQEPTTTGLDIGPGAGSEALDSPGPTADIREIELMRLWLWYRNKDAFDLLSKLREERAAVAPVGLPASPVSPITEPTSEPNAERV